MSGFLGWMRWAPSMRRSSPPCARCSNAVSASRPYSGSTHLPRSDGPAPPLDEPELQPDARVGPYRLLRELGVGGMGAVWLAERADGTLKRQVALKLPRAVWSTGLAQRMARERDILASLEHPHIARLYDAGTDAQGRPFLALEYVEGQPIDVYCRERALNTKARLTLLLQVARAVAFAHSRLVVHRDLKPANILVTAGGQVRLLDFGIAKLMEGDRTQETQLTQLAGHALTLDYASPEQIRGEQIGTASDVYSLGVVAYELLTGARPYKLKRGSAAELEETIATVDAPLASATATDTAARKELRGDLDAILNTALRKDAQQRYASVDALAQDIERHMRGEPVQARPDSTGYRLRKFVGRNRLAVGAAAAVLLAVLTGATVALWQAREAREQARIARIDAQTASAVQNFLEGFFRASSGDQADPMKARQRTAQELLDEGSARIETELDDAPAAKLRVLKTLAEMNMGMGRYERVTQLLEQRVALAERVHPGPSAVRVHALAQLGNQLSRVDRAADALVQLTKADAIAQELGEIDDDTRIALELAWADYYSRSYDARGIERARRGAELLSRRPPSQELVRVYVLLGELERTSGRPADAVRSLRQAIAVADQLPAGGGAGRVNPLLQLAFSESANGNHAAAEAIMREGVAVAERTVGPASSWTINMLGNLGLLLSQGGRLRETLEVMHDARDRLSLLPDTPDSALLQRSILFVEAPNERAFGRPERALALSDQWDSVDKSAAHPVKDSAMLAWRALALTDMGQLAAARSALDRSAAVRKQHNLNDYFGMVIIARSEIPLALASGRTDHAREVVQRWVDHPQALRARRPELLAAIAEVKLATDEPAAAAAAAEAGLAELADPKFAPVSKGSRIHLHLTLARAQLAQGRADDAKRSVLQALEENAAMCDVELSPDRLLALTVLAQASLALGDRAGAKRAFDEAQAIRARHQRLGPQYLQPLERVRAALA